MGEEDTSSSKFAIHEAARNGDKLIVRGLLAENPKLVLLSDEDGRSPLHWAVSFQHRDIVELLLNPLKLISSDDELKKWKKLKVDIDDLVDDSGWNPLHIAVSVGNYQIVKMLMDHDPAPDVEQKTSTGLTLLHLGVAKKHAEIVETLIKEYKESARVKDSRGQYALHRAASVGSTKIAEILVKDGKSPLNAKDNSGWTAMHHALAEGNGDVAVLLVKMGADVTVEDGEGLTPLQVSVDQKVAAFFSKACMEELGIDVS